MVGGGLLSRRPGTLSGDGRLLLCPCGRLVHIYSAVTGERVGSLVGHTAEVTGVLLNPDNDEQVYTCSLDTTVRLWDYRAGEELSRVNVGEPVKHMVVQKDLGVAYFSIQLRGGAGGGRVMLYNLRTRKFSGTAMKTRAAGPLVLSPTGSLAATIDRHSLFVWRTGTDVHQPLNLCHTKPYTCLAISADDSLIAAGDATGRILIWRAFEHSVPSALRDREHSGKAHAAVQPPLTTVHWHAHPVGALTFSPDGTYLLSGGAEGVMVFWQLERNRPSFLPRLGGPIIGIHPSPADPAKYVVRQADNVVRVVNAATMKVETSVLGLRPPPGALLPPAGVAGGAAALLSAGAGTPAGGGSGGSGVLVVACENAQLQFYDLTRDRHMQLLQVAPRNSVSLSDAPRNASHQAGSSPAAVQDSPPPPFVSLVAFSSDGSVMATVDLRSDAGPYGSTEACLKFWDARTSRRTAESVQDEDDSGAASTSGSEFGSGPFSLNTRVDEPHRDLVAALAYHPRRHMAVTTGGAGSPSGSGSDAEFKIWIRERRSAAPGGKGHNSVAPNTHWRCRSTGGFKGLPLGPAAFSPDGSVLAVAAGAKVTLWDAESSALAAVLPAASAAAASTVPPPLTQLTFIPGTPFLAAASPACLAVYNLLTAAVHWCLPYGAVSISADAAYGLLAAALPAPRLSSPPAPAAATAASAPALTTGEPGAAEAPAADAAPARQPHPRHQQKPHPQPQQPPAPSYHVVVFDPRDGSPRYHCHVPGAAQVHVAHLQGASTAAAAASTSGEGSEGCSPLLILRDSRQYSLAALPGSTDLPASTAPRAALEREEVMSALEAAFGRTTRPAAAAAGPTPMDLDLQATAVGGRQPWAELFDAPSHVLPPPTALATAFLTLLTAAGGSGADA